jgi:hypothetical protein
MIQSDFNSPERSEPVRFSGSQFQTVVEALHDAAGNGLAGRTQLSKSSLWDRGMRATFFMGSIRERVGGSLHGLEVNRWSRKSGVAGEVGDNGAGDGNELFSGLCLEPVRNPDALRHSNTSLK